MHEQGDLPPAYYPHGYPLGVSMLPSASKTDLRDYFLKPLTASLRVGNEAHFLLCSGPARTALDSHNVGFAALLFHCTAHMYQYHFELLVGSVALVHRNFFGLAAAGR